MTPDERAAARKRCEAATLGWWRVDVADRLVIAPTGHRIITEIEVVDGGSRHSVADMTFIAHARTDLPAALDALDDADRRIAELERLTLSQAERIEKQSELLSRRAER